MDEIEVHPLRILCHWMLDVVPDEELVQLVEQIADVASYYEPLVTPLVSLTDVLDSTPLASRAIGAE